MIPVVNISIGNWCLSAGCCEPPCTLVNAGRLQLRRRTHALILDTRCSMLNTWYLILDTTYIMHCDGTRLLLSCHVGNLIPQHHRITSWAPPKHTGPPLLTLRDTQEPLPLHQHSHHVNTTSDRPPRLLDCLDYVPSTQSDVRFHRDVIGWWRTVMTSAEPENDSYHWQMMLVQFFVLYFAILGKPFLCNMSYLAWNARDTPYMGQFQNFLFLTVLISGKQTVPVQELTFYLACTCLLADVKIVSQE